jgi:hypothetical protein
MKHTADAVAGAITVSAALQWLPPVAAAVSIIWTILRITEMVTDKTIADLIRRK